MTFSIIGTGNTAWFIATRLAAAGHICVGIYGRNVKAAEQLSSVINAPAYTLTDGIKDAGEVCIIAISDHAINEIVQQFRFTDTVLLHTAGAVDAAILSSAATHYGVIWPIYSIVKDNLPAERNIPTIWEAATPQAKEKITGLLPALTDITYEADYEKRKWLHLTAVFSNNFANHLFAITQKLCAENDLPFNLLLPIAQQTVSRLSTGNAYTLQTGPARRGDEVTLQKHLQLLASYPVWQKLYREISESIGKMYRPQ